MIDLAHPRRLGICQAETVHYDEVFISGSLLPKNRSVIACTSTKRSAVEIAIAPPKGVDRLLRGPEVRDCRLREPL